uniref:microtubule-severing ATPase n=1 Tax=Steinernema glaseri TaxID=37863 RepID=A0A1I8AH59_9BILA
MTARSTRPLTASNYEQFTKLYNSTKDYMRRAIEIDETCQDEPGKRKAIELYRKSLAELEKALTINETPMVEAKKVEVQKRKQILLTHKRCVEGRLGDLVHKYPSSASSSSSSGRTALVKPRVASNSQPRPVAGANDISNDAFRKQLLKNVDPKLGNALLDEVFQQTGVKFEDIVGGAVAKRALEEAVILPALNPKLFSGLRQPVRGILLFGPPGNGKTMLAKAVAAESKSLFFNISASSLTSKWVGEAEKTIRCLFQIARNAQPSIIFIDEVDSILCERSDKETEVSRRMKTEFLVQLDGCKSSDSDRVLVMAATNRPFELDDGILRRFPKRILIDMPDEAARISLIEIVLKKHKTNHSLTNYQMSRLARRTDGYSNADLVSLCREAAMVPIRHLSRSQLMSTTESQVRPITSSDFEEAMQAIKPSVNTKILSKLKEFADANGQAG